MSIAEKAKMMAKTKKEETAAVVAPATLPKQGPEIPMAIHTAEATVVVYGGNLMSKREVELLSLVLVNCIDGDDKNSGLQGKNHGVRVVRFMDDGRPNKEDGTDIFANCSVDFGGVAINLRKHFDAALGLALKEPERSIWAIYNQMLIQSYLHEISHIAARLTPEDREAMANEDPAEEEQLSEKWSLDTLYWLAKTVDLEIGNFQDSPYFLLAWNNLKTASDAEPAWVEKQQHMLENHLTYKLAPVAGEHEGLEMNSMKAFIQLQAPDTDSEEWNKVVGGADLNAIITEAVGLAPVQPVATAANANTADPFGVYDYGSDDAGLQHVMDDPMDGQFTQHASGGMSYSPTPPQMGPVADVYPKNNLTVQQVGLVMQGLYTKLYNHIFGACQQLVNSDVGFGRPEAVAEMPIMLTPEEQQIVVKCRCQNNVGQVQDNVYLGDGALRGFVSSQAKLPMYKLYLNINGQEEVRLVMPQNVAKSNNGSYSQTALQARGGSRIMFVMEGNDAKTQAGAKKYLLKIVDNQIMAC